VQALGGPPRPDPPRRLCGGERYIVSLRLSNPGRLRPATLGYHDLSPWFAKCFATVLYFEHRKICDLVPQIGTMSLITNSTASENTFYQ
jgi:hypothetical protein